MRGRALVVVQLQPSLFLFTLKRSAIGVLARGKHVLDALHAGNDYLTRRASQKHVTTSEMANEMWKTDK